MDEQFVILEGGAASLNVLITSFEPMLANNSDKSFALSFFDKYHSFVSYRRSKLLELELGC